MKRLILAMLLASSGMAMANTAPSRGHSGSEATENPALDRKAAYRDASVAYLASQQRGEQKVSADNGHVAHVDVSAAKLIGEERAETPARSEKSGSFRLYDARRSLLSDVDGDGYHRRFKIRFDADIDYGSTKVYAKLYLRRVGDSGPWRRYFTTDDFWISGRSSSDEYYVETTLTDGFGTGDYDVLIDLYESGYSGVVASLGPADDRALRDLPLEDVGLDVPVANQGYRLDAIKTTLLADDDRDGFHRKFRVEFDPDRDRGTSLVYAVLWVRVPGGTWIKDYTTQNFEVHETGSDDLYRIEADWQSGYVPAKYDIQLDLVDAGTHLLVATASSERPELSRVPLEDANRDKRFDSGNGAGGGGDTSNREGGGGSAALLMLLGFGALLRRRQR